MALATDWTLADASSEALATIPERCCVVSAVLVSLPAAASNSVDALDTVPTMPPTAASNASASECIEALRSSAAWRSLAARCCSMSRTRALWSRNNFSASLMAPISSLRAIGGNSTSSLPSLSCRRAPAIRVSGLETRLREMT